MDAGRLNPQSEIAEFADHQRDKGRSAIWGGATLGLIVGIMLKLTITGAAWWIVGEAVAIGASIGLVTEMLPRLFAKQHN